PIMKRVILIIAIMCSLIIYGCQSTEDIAGDAIRASVMLQNVVPCSQNSIGKMECGPYGNVIWSCQQVGKYYAWSVMQPRQECDLGPCNSKNTGEIKEGPGGIFEFECKRAGFKMKWMMSGEVKQPEPETSTIDNTPQEITKFSARVYEIDPQLTPEPKIIQLTNLDGSGYLRGKYVEIKFPCVTGNKGSGDCIHPPGPIQPYSKDNIFVYEPVVIGNPNYYASTFEGQNFDAVMIYYAINRGAEYFKSLGLGVPKVTVGVMPTPVCSHTVQVPADHDEYGHPLLQLGFPNEACLEEIPNSPYGAARWNAGVNIHELTHFVFEGESNSNSYISYRIKHQPKLPKSDGQLSIINEGYASYFPNSILDTPTYGYQEEGKVGSIDDDYVYRGWTTNEMRMEGIKAFSGALWDVRKELGQEVTDRLIVKSWKLLPTSAPANLVESAFTSLVEADWQLYNGVHRDVIKSEFKRHGIVCSTCVNR
ncbi:MAG: hypothetical protein KKE20_04760, partial [Nanoarchaeota archaeon]|nr:hypothetical protein [Nanoarchaeota archaeon]